MPSPSRKDAQALASAAGEKPKQEAPPAKRERSCVWTEDSQFNLASWVAGKLQATLQAYDIPDVGKLELTFRELSGEENREIEAMLSKAIADRSVYSEGDVMRFRNVAITAASIVAVNRKPWPGLAPDGQERRLAVRERTDLLRSSSKQTMIDLYVKCCSDFQQELLELMGRVDPKLFASPSGNSAATSPFAE